MNEIRQPLRLGWGMQTIKLFLCSVPIDNRYCDCVIPIIDSNSNVEKTIKFVVIDSSCGDNDLPSVVKYMILNPILIRIVM
jgi:hypothetical protein